MEVHETNIFTGIPEIDTLFLHRLDDKTLYNIAQVNMYAYELCMNDIHLRKRINSYLKRPITQTIINPRTGRPIVVGGPAYRALLASQHI